MPGATVTSSRDDLSPSNEMGLGLHPLQGPGWGSVVERSDMTTPYMPVCAKWQSGWPSKAGGSRFESGGGYWVHAA